MATKLSLRFDSTVCRICLETEGKFSLFDPKDNAENFRFITLLEADVNDGLPQFLCSKCHVRLKVAYYFKTQAISANTQLKSYLIEINKNFTKIAGNSKPYEDLENEIEEFNNTLPDNEKIIFGKNVEINNEEPIADPLDENNFEFYDADADDVREEIDNKVEFQIVIQPNKNISVSDSTVPNRITRQNVKKELLTKGTVNKTSPSQLIKDGPRKVNDTFLCSICQNTFTTELNFKRHMEIHLKKRESFDCNICGKLFTQRASVKQHLLIHSGERPFACDECPKTFRRRKTLMGHKKSHKKEKQFECEICNQQFALKKSLIRHINREHNDDDDGGGESDTVLYPCENCDKIYRSKYSLNNHILNQHTSKSVTDIENKCKECNKVFFTKYKLKNHMKYHLPEIENDTKYKINRCLQCPAIFHSKRTLNSHMEIHETNESYKCNICDIIFGRKYKLLLHMQEHEKNTNENNYSCRKCKKDFNILENLYEHLKAHIKSENEKYKCLHCDERLLSKSSLKSHIVSEHKNAFKEWNICTTCDLTFLTYDTYYDHIIQNHSIFNGDCRECGACFETEEEINEHSMEHDVINNNE